MGGIHFFTQGEYQQAMSPYYNQAQACDLFHAAGLEAMVFRLPEKISGCFEAVPGSTQAEIYYVVSGQLLLQPLDEPDRLLGAGDLFCLHDRSAAVLFQVKKELTMLLFDNARPHQAQDQVTQSLHELLAELQEKDNDTLRHSERVRLLSMQLAAHMPSFDRSRFDILVQAARFHDVGKCMIPSTILNKPAALTPTERAVIQRHSLYSAQMVEPHFGRETARILRHHHERWDGGGYPDGLAGEDIPQCSRVIAVADAYDAMTTERPYHHAISMQAAMAELEAGAGRQFDPACVAAFRLALPGLEKAQAEDYILNHAGKPPLPPAGAADAK